MGSLDSFKSQAAYPDRERLAPITIYSIRGILLASQITVKNDGLSPVDITMEVQAGNNANNLVGSLNIEAALDLGDIAHNGTAIPAGGTLMVRAGLALAVQTAGNVLAATALDQVLVPANGEGSRLVTENFTVPPLDAIQIQFKDLVNIASYSVRVIAIGSENV